MQPNKVYTKKKKALTQNSTLRKKVKVPSLAITFTPWTVWGSSLCKAPFPDISQTSDEAETTTLGKG